MVGELVSAAVAIAKNQFRFSIPIPIPIPGFSIPIPFSIPPISIPIPIPIPELELELTSNSNSGIELTPTLFWYDLPWPINMCISDPYTLGRHLDYVFPRQLDMATEIKCSMLHHAFTGFIMLTTYLWQTNGNYSLSNSIGHFVYVYFCVCDFRRKQLNFTLQDKWLWIAAISWCYTSPEWDIP